MHRITRNHLAEREDKGDDGGCSRGSARANQKARGGGGSAQGHHQQQPQRSDSMCTTVKLAPWADELRGDKGTHGGSKLNREHMVMHSEKELDEALMS